jgi:hypothetical protein
MKRLLFLGATGLIGQNVLAQALADPSVAQVVAPTRRSLASHLKLLNPIVVLKLCRKPIGERPMQWCAAWAPR